MTDYQFLTHNHKDTLLVVSTYPTANTTHTGGGLASYTQNTLLSLKKAYPKQKIVVLANIIDQEETYLENGILVVRCWQRNFPAIYFQLLQKIIKFNQINNLLLGFEFAAFGDFWITSFMPVFTATTRLLGKHLTTVIHQVVLKLDELVNHVGLHSGFKLNLYNALLKLFYQGLIITSNQIVTLETNLADRLQRIYPSQKIHAIPHGLFPQKALNKRIARQKLDLMQTPYYVLAFGYLSHYKGTDLLVKAFAKPIFVNGHQVKLILAGDKNPTQGHKNHYRRFYSRLFKNIRDNHNIIATGFVATKDIKKYFSAADLAIFPYRSFMSASGPVSLSLSFGTPYIVSTKIRHYSPLVTSLKPESIRKSIIDALSDKKTLNQSKSYFHQMVEKRHFHKQAKEYLNLVNLGYA